MKLLTNEECAELPEGAQVEIIWSGGNGPHRYVINIGHFGVRYAGDIRNGNTIGGETDFVGDQPYHTRVWLVDE